MNNGQQPNKIFYGWIIVAVALAIISLGMGLMLSLGVFMEPLQLAFGWGRRHIASANMYGWLAYGVSSFVFGTLSDRFGTRWIVLIGGLMFGLGMLALSQMQTLWQFYLAYGLLVGGGAGAFMVPLTSTVTRWFTQRRGLVVALANCGIGVGGMVFAPLTRSLLIHADWQTAFFLYGCLSWVVVLPLAFLIRNAPEDMGLQPYGGVPATTGSSIARGTTLQHHVFHTPAFWSLAAVHFLCCAAHSGPIFHMVSAAIDTGIDKLAAASIFAIASLASVPGRVGTGMLADRFGSKGILVTWLVLQATAIALYLCLGGLSGFALIAMLFGLSYGGVMPLYALVAREFFGAQAMGASYGGIFMLSCIGMGLGAWFGGWIFDSAQTYALMYTLGFLSSAIGAVLATQLRAPQADDVPLSRPQPLQVS